LSNPAQLLFNYYSTPKRVSFKKEKGCRGFVQTVNCSD